MDDVAKIIEQWQKQGFDTDKLMAMECLGRIKRTEVFLTNTLASNYKKNYNIALWEFDVLATLRRSGDPYCLSPTALFASMMVTSGAMTNRLNQLEKRSFIKRVENKEDGRSLLVQLTEEGLALINQLIVDHIELENQLLADFNPQEIHTLNTLLTKLESSLVAR